MTDPIAGLFAAHQRTLRTRHDEALAVSGFDRVIVYSGQPHPQFLDDRLCSFEANPHFKCWVPLTEHPGCAVVAGSGETPRLIYLQPRDYWHLPPQDPAGYWTEHFEVEIVRSDDEVVAALADLAGNVAIIGEALPEGLAALGEVNPKSLIDILHFERAAKTDYEVECMRRANAIAARGHLAAERVFRDGGSEFDIHLEYCRACGQTPAELPYDNIIALNGHGAVLHYHAYEDRRDTPRAFLIDAGASCNGYAADITRTYSAEEDDFAGLIGSVNAAQLEICDLAAPGVDYVDLHLEANRRMAAVLVDHGVLTCSAETAVERGIVGTFFPHGLGHYIGTQVHDVGGHQASPAGEVQPPPQAHPFLRLTRTLTPRAVCTIEPGVYFIDMLLAELRGSDSAAGVDWDAVERFRPYGGVRIEDDVYITASGHENLTRPHLG